MLRVLALHAIRNLVEEEAHIGLREVALLENFRDRLVLQGLLNALRRLLELGLLLVVLLQVLLSRLGHVFGLAGIRSSLSLLILRQLPRLPRVCRCISSLSSSRG